MYYDMFCWKLVWWMGLWFVCVAICFEHWTLVVHVVVNGGNWVLLWIFRNIPLAIVLSAFFRTLVVLWTRVCAPDRGMKSGDVVAIASSGCRVVLGYPVSTVVVVLGFDGVVGVMVARWSDGYMGQIGILLALLPSTSSYNIFIASSSTIMDLLCDLCLYCHTTNDVNVATSFLQQDSDRLRKLQTEPVVTINQYIKRSPGRDPKRTLRRSSQWV